MAKATGAGVVDLSCCLSYEQLWQRCGKSDVKVLLDWGKTGMAARVVHVTNQGQSVQKRVKEGMKGRSLGLKCNPLPLCDCGGGLGDAPLQTSFVFNDGVGLHVYNQQEYELVVDHEFVDILGWQWSLHAMVLHIGATKNEGHFLVYVVFEDKWWLCDDVKVKGDRPAPKPRKATFLSYKRKPTNLLVSGMSQFASQRTRASTLKDKGDAQSMPTDTCVPAMAPPPGDPPPPLFV